MDDVGGVELTGRRFPWPRGTAVAAVMVVGVTLWVGTGAAWASGPGTANGSPVVPAGAAIHPATAATGTEVAGSLTMPGGLVRTYTIYVPSGLARGRAVPLLVGLHGGLGDGAQFEANTDFDGLAQANSFIVVYPDGTPLRPGSARLVWNGGGCCAAAQDDRNDVDDVGFISALIAKLERRYDIDRHAVFVTGHSNGAILAERLACQLSGQVDAIAVQSGVLYTATCHPTHPVAVMEIHGTADQNIPINGGYGARSLVDDDFPAPVTGLRTLAARDGCPGRPTRSGDPANDAVHFEIWRPCRGGTVVEWVTVTGANHAWMGHPGTAASRLLVGQPYLGFDSSAAVWSFLAAHPRT